MQRRRFLQGLGGISVALPMGLSMFASRGAAQMGGTGPRRILTVAYPMGTYNEGWIPAEVGTNFSLGSVTEPLDDLKDRCLFVSEVDNAVHQLCSAHSFGHPGKEATTLTGGLTTASMNGSRNHVDQVNPNGDAEGSAMGPSVDEVIGRYLRSGSHERPSVNLGVNGLAMERPSETRDSQFFFESASNPVTLTTEVGAAFNQLFGMRGGDMTDPAIAYLHARNRSVLDAVRDSFTDLRQGLGRTDRRVLDDHAEKIRELEQDVIRLMCAPPAGVDGASALTMLDIAPLTNRIAAAAMGCGIAPVARIEYTEQQRPVFGIPVVDQEAPNFTDWHGLVHEYGDGRPGRVEGFRFFVDMYARLLRELAATPDGSDGQSLLDTSMVLLATNFGRGQAHSARRMNFIVAGNLGDARTGFHYKGTPPGEGFYGVDSAYNVNHFLNSLVAMAGVRNDDGSPMTEFGIEGFAAGGIPELF